MKISTTTAAVLMALLATTVSANQETAEPQMDSTGSQDRQDVNNEPGAHGYQNPTGEDPQPRLTEDTIENAHGDDEEVDDEEESQQR
jgi:hypothetical protein